MSVDAELNQVKPLAMADYPGWVNSSGILIGAFDRTWVGGYSLAKKGVEWWVKGDTPLAAPITKLGNWVMLGFRDGKIKKVEAQTGKVVWEVTLDSFVSRRMTLIGANLIVITSGQQLYSLDFQNGSTQWLYDAGFPDSLTIHAGAPPVAHNESVFVGLASGEVHAVNLRSGKLEWKFDPESKDARFQDVVGEMVVRGTRVLMSRYDGLVVSIENGEFSRATAWSENLQLITTSKFRNGRYYVGTLAGDVVAFEAESGRKLWQAKTAQSVSTITVGESVVYVSGTEGRINALQAKDGKELWHDDVGGAIVSQPFVYNNGIFFSTGLKNIYGYYVE